MEIKNSNCKHCGKPATVNLGNTEHKIFGKAITLKEAPYIDCSCGASYYENEHIVNITIRDAYREGVSTVLYPA